LESFEAIMHQDLNGDGISGPPPLPTTRIEPVGTTSTGQVRTNYFLDSISSGTGPELKYLGAAVAAGQFGAWAPIGAEQTGGGYDVVWKNLNADQYTVFIF